MSHDRVAVQTGSAALTICVKETAPAPAHGGLAFTRYCHYQYCMVYGIHKGGWEGGVYCAIVVQ